MFSISDAGGNNNELFCTRCSIPFAMDDYTVRHRQRLSDPEETEAAVASVSADIIDRDNQNRKS